MIVRDLDIIDALGIVPRLTARHREEILLSHSDLNAWARERVTLPGVQCALEVEGQVMVIGGVIDQGDTGTLWLAGAMGWERHVLPVMRVFRIVKEHGRFKALHCKCAADNPPAQKMVERLGFSRGEPRDGVVPYEMVIP